MRSTVWSVGFDPSGKKLVSGSSDKTVRVWDATTGEPIGSPLGGHTGNPESSVSCLAAIQAHFIREEFPPFFGEDECWVDLEDDLISKDHLQELLSDPDMNLTEADIEVLHVDALFDYLLSLDASQGELVKKDVFNKALEQADTSTVVYNPTPRLLCTLTGHMYVPSPCIECLLL